MPAGKTWQHSSLKLRKVIFAASKDLRAAFTSALEASSAFPISIARLVTLLPTRRVKAQERQLQEATLFNSLKAILVVIEHQSKKVCKHEQSKT